MDNSPDNRKEEVKPKQEPENKLSLAETFLKNLQSTITFIVGLAAIFTASGFIVINSYLSKYTDIFGYNIVATQYITAGIGAWLWGFLVLGYIVIASAVLITPVSVASFIIYFVVLQTSICSYSSPEPLRKQWVSAYKDVLQKTRSALKRIYQSNVYRVILAFIGLVFGILGFSVYCTSVYETMPRYLGGGSPSEIIIVLNNPAKPTDFGLSQDANFQNRTMVVDRLAELTDGILVFDRHTETVAAIKDSAIIGIIDPNSGIRPIATPEATPEVTGTPETTPP